jgi:DNA topoisomerase-1
MTKITVRKHTKKKGKIKVRRHKRKPYIPPAWTRVKRFKKGPILATGYDEKGRLQYVYDHEYREQQDKDKFKRIEKLNRTISPVMGQIAKEADEGKQEAQAIYTMYKTGFRPGTEKDTKADKPAYGVLTLKTNQVKVKPSDKVQFKFPGKWNVKVNKEIRDKRLARIMRQRLRGRNLFGTNATNTRRYLQKKTDDKFKMKDFRTLVAHKTAKKVSKNRSNGHKEISTAVSKELNNTPKIAANSYIAPKFLKS